MVNRRKIGRIEREAWGDGGRLLRRRALRRVACQRGTLRGGTVDGDQIIIGQKAGAKLHVILEVKGTASLVFCAVRGHGHRLGQVLHTPDTTELLMRVLGNRQPGSSPVTPTVVSVGYCRSSGGCRLLVGVGVIVRRHYDWRSRSAILKTSKIGPGGAKSKCGIGGLLS